MAIAKLLSAIAMHDTSDLQLRRQMLLSQLALGYEFVNYYRKEQDRQLGENRTATLYASFCDLVVMHHREHRDVQFYAAQLGYSTRYFSMLFLKASNGITALDYIGQYVCNRAHHGHRPPTRPSRPPPWSWGSPPPVTSAATSSASPASTHRSTNERLQDEVDRCLFNSCNSL